ncbi:endopeptidase La [Candidatus Dependentiae bacterium]|nr:endopeptidase La [Candidatus Dependentiae bacterium]
MTEPGFLPVLPLKNLVALPKSIIPVVVGREISIRAIDVAMKGNKEVFVTAQRSIDTENPTIDDVFLFGTRAAIVQVARMANGTLKVLIEGLTRSEVVSVEQADGFLAVIARDLIPDQLAETSDNTALFRNLYDLFKEYVGLNEKMSTEVLSLFHGLEDLDYLCDTVAVQMHLEFDERQRILELVDLKERALSLCVLLQKEMEILKAEKNIKKRVQSQVEKHQRDYYLNEQMRAIQRELGREDQQQEINDLRQKAKSLKLSPEALEKVEAELKRLEQMQPTSPEATVSRNYIDVLLSVPWHVQAKDSVSMKGAEGILNASHAGLKKAKERVVEFIAAKKFAGDKLKKAPIICLAGPPGVGKTSLGHSIAEALNRPLVRIALGGVRDEAEIRGHRRTYIGAMPGKIVQGMRKAKVTNPVLLLDEIDKMAMDFRGDPASALLEVLDPEQNRAFNDHFMEVDYDLSKVMFITTANVIDNIPYPLLDRMEIISLSGYTEDEKLAIAKKFLIPKLLDEYKLKDTQVMVSDIIIRRIIDEYTKEAGVRQLERTLAKLMRKAIQVLLKVKATKQVEVTSALLEEWLGAPIYRQDDRNNRDAVGVVTGLAWTEVGGDVLDVEVTVMKGKGALTLTGQLGEVMQESAQAAMSFVRSSSKDLGLKDGFYADVDIHVHVPEGSIPKDGPSAGITICLALVSALTGIAVKPHVAMTGEITLRGRVLQIGGLKEKLLAATRLGITMAIVPKSNARDVQEFASELNKDLKVVYVEHMNEVLDHALVKKPTPLLDADKRKNKKAKKAAEAKKPIRKSATKKRAK